MKFHVIENGRGGWKLIYADKRLYLAATAAFARAAAKRKDFRENARLCRLHDDLAVRG